MTSRVLAGIFAASTICHAQLFEIGAKGGVTITQPVAYASQDESKRYVVGASFELKIREALSLEIDGLYRRQGTSGSFGDNTGRTYTQRYRANIVEVPVLGKYYFAPKGSAFRPFLTAGIGLQKATGYFEGNFPQGDPPVATPYHSEINRPWSVGGIGGLGVRFQHGRIAYSPEFRYSRYGAYYPGNRNRVEFMMGFSF